MNKRTDPNDFVPPFIGKTSSFRAIMYLLWNVVKHVGKNIEKHEAGNVNEGYSSEKKDAKVIFEEMDGVWLSMQGKNHKKEKNQELKVATIYEGWDAVTGKKLIGKQVVAGMEPSGKFKRMKDNAISRTYNTDEIEYRILNGDGGSWITDEADGTTFQLDRFHVLKDIRAKIKDKRAAKDISALYKSAEPDKMIRMQTVSIRMMILIRQLKTQESCISILKIIMPDFCHTKSG